MSKYGSHFLFKDPEDGGIPTPYYTQNREEDLKQLQNSWGPDLSTLAYALQAPDPESMSNMLLSLVSLLRTHEIKYLFVLEGKGRFFLPLLQKINRDFKMGISFRHIDVGDFIEKNKYPNGERNISESVIHSYIEHDSRIHTSRSFGKIGIFDEVVDSGTQVEFLRSVLRNIGYADTIPVYYLNGDRGSACEQQNYYPLNKEYESWFLHMQYPSGCKKGDFNPQTYKFLQKLFAQKILEHLIDKKS